MKYDDASYHYGGNFPKDLPIEAGATHTGMFLAWAMLSGLAGELHLTEFPEGIQALTERSITPGRFLLEYCDGKFTDEDVNEVGNTFAASYFDFKNGLYLTDYENVLLNGLPSLYHVPDSWQTYETLKPTLDARFSEWRSHAG
jgi:hypothetical protein